MFSNTIDKNKLCLSYKFINKKCHDMISSDWEWKSFLSLTNKDDFYSELFSKLLKRLFLFANIDEINSVTQGLLTLVTFFSISFLISVEITCFFFRQRWLGILLCFSILLSSNFSPLVIMSKIYGCLMYLHQFSVKYRKLPPSKVYTSCKSLFFIVFILLELTINISFLLDVSNSCYCDVSGIDQFFCFGNHIDFDLQGF